MKGKLHHKTCRASTPEMSVSTLRSPITSPEGSHWEESVPQRVLSMDKTSMPPANESLNNSWDQTDLVQTARMTKSKFGTPKNWPSAHGDKHPCFQGRQVKDGP